MHRSALIRVQFNKETTVFTSSHKFEFKKGRDKFRLQSPTGTYNASFCLFVVVVVVVVFFFFWGGGQGFLSIKSFG